jgi:RNA polymerase sigma-70 factor (ECF subfamily)
MSTDRKRKGGVSAVTACSVRLVVTGDAQLAADFATGDPDTVRSVYATYGRLVYAVAYKVLGDAGLAEDATQLTFLQAWRSCERFDPTRAFGPWLATIARRVAIDVYRQSRRNQGHAGLEAAEAALISPPPSAERIYDVWEVRRAVDALPPDEAEVVRLQHFEGLTHTEIAARVGLPVGTVKSRTHRAHRRLVGLLDHLRATADEPGTTSTQGGGGP